MIQQFNELYIESQNKNNKKIIGRLIAVIEKYPKSPQLKNFLSVAYHIRRNYKKALEVNNRIMAEHPDYLFAKINAAHNYMNAGLPEKVPDILGQAMEIKELYPERSLFHLAEVTGFYNVAIRYYSAMKSWEIAEDKFTILKEIAPVHPDTEAAEAYLFSGRMEENFKIRKEREAALIKVKSLKPVPVSKKTTAPTFNHVEINNLYNYGLAIPHEIIKDLSGLPRDTLIKDLEEVLLDAIDRYPYFRASGWEEDTHHFPLHACYLLVELKAESSLQAMLNFLKNDKEVIEFWFGECPESTLWLPVYLLSQNNLEALRLFLLEPGIDTVLKSIILEALIQTVLHSPEKRDELFSIYKNVFIYLDNATLDDNVIDSEFLGLLVSNMIDAGFKEMLPHIKELYDKGYVSFMINGNYEEAESYFNEPLNNDIKREIENIFDFYTNRVNEFGDEEEDSISEDEIQVSAVSDKIGRNDLCPCGSGKKYKKCCLNKLPL